MFQIKLLITIVHDEDAIDLVDELNSKGYRVTKLASTGGFLKSGNTTMITGVEDDKIEECVNIIKSISRKRDKMVLSPTPSAGAGVYIPYPIEVETGGATVFVVDVDTFIKI